VTSKEVAVATASPLELCTNMQRLFVEGRLNGLPPKAAGAFAGMAEASIHVEAYRMDKHPKVRAAIEYVLTSGKDVEVTREYIVEGFKDAVRASKDATELTNAYRELGKLMGHYAAEKRIDITAEATMDDIRQMSDKELMGASGAGMKEAVGEVIDAEFIELIDICQPLVPEDSDAEASD
jgi:hypothetical protein